MNSLLQQFPHDGVPALDSEELYQGKKMKKFTFIQCISVLLFCALAWTASAGAKARPKFEGYSVTSIYAGKPAKVVLSTPDAKLFRTRLREAATGPVTFAGEHVLAIFGCGTGCIYGAAINLRTGRVVFLPGSVSAWYGEGERLEYRANSRLLVAKGEIGESSPTGHHYYEFTGREFKHLMTVPCTTNEDHNACLER